MQIKVCELCGADASSVQKEIACWNYMDEYGNELSTAPETIQPTGNYWCLCCEEFTDLILAGDYREKQINKILE